MKSNDDKPYITCIVSMGRAFRVKPMEELVENPVWFVPKDELNDYVEEYTVGSIQPCESGLSVQRNDALEYCFKRNKICLMLDDDINGFTRIINKKKTENISYTDTINELYTNLINSPMNMGGFSALSNLFWFDPLNRISLRTPIPTAVLMIKPSKPIFDINMEVSEDYDFALQHIVEYGGAMRINYIRVEVNQTRMDNKKLTIKKTMEGGIDYDIEKVKDSYYYLKKKWGNLVREGKTPYQVVFRV